MSSFIDSLKSSEACVKAREREIYLKDQFLKTVAEYDARLIWKGEKKIFPRYIRELDFFLLAMSDDDLDEFYINEESCRARLFDAMKADFDRFGPVSKQRVLEAIEFILSSGQFEKFWGYVVPQSVPLDEVEDKPGYLRALYEKLSGHAPPMCDFGPDVELVSTISPPGIDIRE